MENDKKLVYKVLPIRLEESNYRAWRKLAYLNEMSMAKMIRTLVEEKLKETKKVLTNSDIAI
jgi:hypothetical protein